MKMSLSTGLQGLLIVGSVYLVWQANAHQIEGHPPAAEAAAAAAGGAAVPVGPIPHSNKTIDDILQAELLRSCGAASNSTCQSAVTDKIKRWLYGYGGWGPGYGGYW